MNAREARMAFEAGRLPAEQLFDLLERQERLIQRLQAQVQRLEQRLAQYEPQARHEATPPDRDGRWRGSDRPSPASVSCV